MLTFDQFFSIYRLKMNTNKRLKVMGRVTTSWCTIKFMRLLNNNLLLPDIENKD